MAEHGSGDRPHNCLETAPVLVGNIRTSQGHDVGPELIN
jgi:hypothetical protein